MEQQRLNRLWFLSTVQTHSPDSLSELHGLVREACWYLSGQGCAACKHAEAFPAEPCHSCNDNMSGFELDPLCDEKAKQINPVETLFSAMNNAHYNTDNAERT